MSYPVSLFVAALVAYVIGATPFGFLAGKIKGIDIREHGSGNIGATNVLRTLGKQWGIPVFVLDVLKGVVPVLLGRWICEGAIEGGADNAETLRALAAAVSGLAAIAGHNFTFWLGFKGGKGVATSAGALLAVMPVPVLVGIVVWVVIFYSTGYVAVASIFAGLSLPLSVFLEGMMRDGAMNWIYLATALLVAVMGVLRHESNIRRLREGTEHSFKRRKSRFNETHED
ncbi:MAG: glycerol-3-phosphate 1-O-acyltransferase PlsY [Verrucomicrobiota bacterium]